MTQVRHKTGGTSAWARRFFETGHDSLKWQGCKPYEKFATIIDRHWDGIAVYCTPENKVALGFVEGLNNKSRVSSSGGATAYATSSTCA